MELITNAFIFNAKKVLFVFHKRKSMWMHVGGHVKENEFLEEALKREIKEEVNLDVEIIDKDEGRNFNIENLEKIKKPFFMHGNKKENNEKPMVFDYICKTENPEEIKLKKDEVSDYKWISKDELGSLNLKPGLKELALLAFEEYEENPNKNDTKNF